MRKYGLSFMSYYLMQHCSYADLHFRSNNKSLTPLLHCFHLSKTDYTKDIGPTFHYDAHHFSVFESHSGLFCSFCLSSYAWTKPFQQFESAQTDVFYQSGGTGITAVVYVFIQGETECIAHLIETPVWHSDKFDSSDNLWP